MSLKSLALLLPPMPKHLHDRISRALAFGDRVYTAAMVLRHACYFSISTGTRVGWSGEIGTDYEDAPASAYYTSGSSGFMQLLGDMARNLVAEPEPNFSDAKPDLRRACRWHDTFDEACPECVRTNDAANDFGVEATVVVDASDMTASGKKINGILS